MQRDPISTVLGFHSTIASRIARTGVALSSLAALAVVPGWEPMLGCLGFLGLIGVATLAEGFARRSTNVA